MESVLGLVGKGFAVMVADTWAMHSILVHKSNEDKVMVLNSHKLLGASGEPGDRVQFTEYIQKNVHVRIQQWHVSHHCCHCKFHTWQACNCSQKDTCN